MNLNYICEKVICNILKPGVKVECMDDKFLNNRCPGIKKGEIFKIVSQELGLFGNCLLKIKKEDYKINYTFSPSRFRKVDP